MSERAAPIPPRRGWLAGLRLLGLLALPVLFLELCARLGEAQPAPTASPIRPLFLVGAALIATLGRPIREAPHSWRLPWAGLALLARSADRQALRSHWQHHRGLGPRPQHLGRRDLAAS